VSSPAGCVCCGQSPISVVASCLAWAGTSEGAASHLSVSVIDACLEVLQNSHNTQLVCHALQTLLIIAEECRWATHRGTAWGTEMPVYPSARNFYADVNRALLVRKDVLAMTLDLVKKIAVSVPFRSPVEKQLSGWRDICALCS
jgi:hypothetical protein